MKNQSRWIKILTECKNCIQDQITPLLETLDQPQPNLGVGAGGDPIKAVDLKAESALVHTLKENEVSFTLISEESGIEEHGSTPKNIFVTVDPIDGTTNLMRGIPFYATSIAVSRKPRIDKVYAALVSDLVHEVTYTAEKNKGAYRNDERISPSKISNLAESIIGIDFNTLRIPTIAPIMSDLIRRTKHIRHLGANALELCYVADGTTDAFIDIRGKLRTTDVAAAFFIMEEAGAVIVAPTGEPLKTELHPEKKVTFIGAANRKIQTKILRYMQKDDSK